MVRLLIALLVLCLSVYLLVFKREPEQRKQEVIYQDALDKANNVEQQMLDAADQQKQRIDELAR